MMHVGRWNPALSDYRPSQVQISHLHVTSMLSVYLNFMRCTDWDLRCSNSAIAFHAYLI